MDGKALESTLTEIFTSLQLDAESSGAGRDVDDDEDDKYISDDEDGEQHENGEGDNEKGSTTSAQSSKTEESKNGKYEKKKFEDPSYRSVTAVSNGECTLDIDFHGVLPEALEHVKHKKIRATFSFVPGVGEKEGTLIIMKAIPNQPRSQDDPEIDKKPKTLSFPTDVEYLVRRQPHTYPKLYMEPLTEIEVGVLMNFPRESYRPLNITVGWLHWKSGRFRAQDPHNHIPIVGLDGSCVDVREIYREVTRQFSAYCQDRRVRTISFRNDQEVFFALGFYTDSRNPSHFIRRLVNDVGNVLTLYQFLLLHDSVQPGRKRLYVWTATRRKPGKGGRMK